MAFDKLTYWKNRMNNKLKTAYGWASRDFQDIRDFSLHMKLNDEYIQDALAKIDEGFVDLRQAILASRVKKEEKTNE